MSTGLDVPPHKPQDVRHAVNSDWFRPVLPSNNQRYQFRSTVQIHHTTIGLAAHLSTRLTAPTYHTRDWQCLVHPEGKPYNARGHEPTILTEVAVDDEDMSGLVDECVQFILSQATSLGLSLHSTVELWVEPDLESKTCSYYFADHDARSVFWLTECETEEMGLPATCSGQHLRHTIEENYWNHVEMFPMHLASLPDGALDELVAVFMHGYADHMTSPTSTFPYSKEDTSSFLDILQKAQSLPPNPYIFTFVARLWSMVASSRHINHYGEAHCRLDRNTPILAPRAAERTRLQSAVSSVLFRIPDGIRAELDDQYVDGVVSGSQWASFMGAMMDSWRQSMQWTFALLTVNVLSLPAATSTTLAHSSLLMCATSVLVAVVLRHHHETLAKADPIDAVVFLNEHDSDTGFQSLATVYSIPQAFFIWALVLFTVHAACLFLCILPLSLGLLSGFILLTVGVAVWKTLHPAHRLSRLLSFSAIPTLFSGRPQIQKSDLSAV